MDHIHFLKSYSRFQLILITLLIFNSLYLTAQTCLPGGISFRRQSQIDSFPINYPGCTEILGEVIIDGNDPNSIHNLDSLIQIIRINSDLEITHNSSLTNLQGLNNLTFIGRDLFVFNNSNLTSLDGLDLLDTVNKRVHIESNASLTRLLGLKELIHVGEHLTFSSNSLTSIGELSGLQAIGGVLAIGFEDLVSLDGIQNIDPTSIIELYIRHCSNLAICQMQSICDYLDLGRPAIILGNAPGCNSIEEIQMECNNIVSCVVTNTNDNGPGSLREGINCLHSGDTLYFDASMINATINLDSVITLSKNITIYASPSQQISIYGTGIDTTLHIMNGTKVELINLVIRGSNGPQGVIWNEGDLTLNNVNVLGDETPGAVFLSDGILNLGYGSSILILGENDVFNPATGKVWMDRNLGASQVATSSTDVAAYGDLYQWGRDTDGHEVRTSSTYGGPVESSVPNDANDWDGKFVTVGVIPYDWLITQDGILWMGVSGMNNPCPTGYRLPTESEWEAERLSWISNDAAGAFASPLKLPLAGIRSYLNGSLFNVGSMSSYWSSTVSSTSSRFLYFYTNIAGVGTYYRADGNSVRCIKDQ